MFKICDSVDSLLVEAIFCDTKFSLDFISVKNSMILNMFDLAFRFLVMQAFSFTAVICFTKIIVYDFELQMVP